MRLTIILTILCFAASQLSSAEQPNIVWIVSEDNSPYLGCYGDTVAKTPHLDQLSAEGVTYDFAWAAAPVCAPSRSSLISGVPASSLGTANMRSRMPVPDHIRWYPEYLRDAGYYCTNNAKTDYNTSSKRMEQAWHASSYEANWNGRGKDQPFFAIFNLGDTHEGQLHKTPEITTDPALVKVPGRLPDNETSRKMMAQYYDRMADMDTQAGKILERLDKQKLTDDTIVFYYSDHGGSAPGSKRFLRNDGLQVPLIIKFAKLRPPSSR